MALITAYASASTAPRPGTWVGSQSTTGGQGWGEFLYDQLPDWIKGGALPTGSFWDLFAQDWTAARQGVAKGLPNEISFFSPTTTKQSVFGDIDWSAILAIAGVGAAAIILLKVVRR